MTQSRLIFPILMLMLGACSDPETLQRSDAPVLSQAEDSCVDDDEVVYLCGVINGEDILPLGDSEWLLVSGMNGELSGSNINGKLHLVSPRDRSFRVLFPGNNPSFEQDSAMFTECPGPIDVSNFSAHGLALQSLRGQSRQFRLYMTSHGAREAIEVFKIDASATPVITWIGCVPMPETSWTNSVAILEDGGFVATQFMDPTARGMAGVIAREITGHVFEWHPGESLGVIPGSELSGPNGIVISDDERWIYVAAFGTHELVRFDRQSIPLEKESIALDIAPDNVRWSTDGMLLTAGGNITAACAGPNCGAGWSVVEVDPELMEAERIAGAGPDAAMQSISTALRVGDDIWVGSYGGDRLGIVPGDQLSAE